ncbi:MAG: hypothetical protein ABSB22_17010 [Thermodesulfobacteriota bacterium]|jgi:hypothetical protein
MKSFKLDEILLVAHNEKRARRVTFHPTSTVIRGPNDTGKSTIIKNIYYALGATPTHLDNRWKQADISLLVRFKVDEMPYSIYRQGASFSIFSNNHRLIGTFGNVTNELGPKLADLFDFKLTLVEHEGEIRVPPPAFLFLPYYIDQDAGWARNWSSFENLGQFKNWRRDLIYYHTGIHPNEWYELKAEAIKLQAKQEDPSRREAMLKDVMRRLETQLSKARFDIDVKSYKKEIDELLKRCEVLRKQEEEYKDKLVDLETERIRLEAQREIVTLARQELQADYVFSSKLEEDHVQCPTCGALYANSFAERFAIARDEDRCNSLLHQIRDDLKKVEDNIQNHRRTLADTSEELNAVNALLAEKQGEVTLKDLIENEGKRGMAATLQKNLEEVQGEIAKIQTQLRDIDEKIKKYADPAGTREIIHKYQESLRRYRAYLNLTKHEGSGAIEASVKESGSDLPRAMLAYFFSILNVVGSFGSSTFCPIIIDAPRQQEQDDVNHRIMLQFIRDNRPEGSQLILGLVDDCGIDFGGSVVDMTEKYSVLREKDYKEIAGEIRYYADANLGLTSKTS